jgi:hypothetical protein
MAHTPYPDLAWTVGFDTAVPTAVPCAAMTRRAP